MPDTIEAVPAVFLRRPQVQQITGLSRTSIYRLIDQNLFPRPMQIGPNSVAWHSGDLNAWIESRKPTPDKPAKGV